MRTLLRQQGLVNILNGKVPSPKEERFMSHKHYSSVFGSIIYVMQCIHPYISQVVSVVSPDKIHWQVVKLILRLFTGRYRCWFSL
jgi:hypothetical protein